MKVSINKESKKVITLAQAEAAKYIVEAMKEDESTPAEYAGYAVRAICNAYDIYGSVDVIRAEAYILPNNHVWEQWGERSENLDIWITGIAICGYDDVVRFGAYISDIWALDGDNYGEIVPRMEKHIYRRDLSIF